MKDSQHSNSLNRQQLEHSLGGQLQLVERIGRAADSIDRNAYLVGGATRDIVMGNPVNDLDIAVSSKGHKLVNLLINDEGARLSLESRFSTWIVKLDDVRIDIAVLRKESYSSPGAMPSVTPSDLADDARRRDFTINSLAISINHASFGELADHVGGISDIENGLVRTIHQRSFEDDPTRIMRAILYTTRLGFMLEQGTLQQIHDNLHFTRLVQPHRIEKEIFKWMKEERCSAIFSLAQQLGVLQAIHSSFVISESSLKELEKEQQHLSPYERFAILANGLPMETDLVALAERLGFVGRLRAALVNKDD